MSLFSTHRHSDKVAPEAPHGVDIPNDFYKGPHWTVNIDQVLPIKYGPGFTSKEESPARTITDVFQAAVKANPDKIALRVERGLPSTFVKGEAPPPTLPDNEWTTWTYQQYYDDCTRIGKALIALGSTTKDCVAIYGTNAPEWSIACIGSTLVNVKPSGLYPTDTEESALYKLQQSGTIAAFCSDESKLAKFVSVADEAKTLKVIVCWDPSVDLKQHQSKCEAKLLTWSEFMDSGNDVEQKTLDDTMATVQPGGCALLIYTSGTTGRPKAVMLSHDNLVFDCKSVTTLFTEFKEIAQHKIVSYLPLSHILGCLFDMVAPIYITGADELDGYCTVSFARTYDMKAGSLFERVKSVKPTIFLGVPRVFEKIADKLRTKFAEAGGLKKMLVDWALKLGLEHAQHTQIGGTGEYPAFYGVAEKLVYKKILAAVGLDECFFIGGGGAAFQRETLEFFGSLGVTILEGYGMSETTGASSVNVPEAHQWGTIGPALPGVEMKIFKFDPANPLNKVELPKAQSSESDDASEGEICFRGRTMMLGYMGNPDLGEDHIAKMKKKTAEAIDGQGWLHSEDKGAFNDKGMLKICGRYKELIIGSGGENIAPIPIEECLSGEHGGLSNVLMVGNKRKYNVVLITLKEIGATGPEPGNGQLAVGASEINKTVTTVKDALDDEVWIESIKEAIQKTNANGKCCPSNAAKIQKFTILPTDFSIAGGELGPTLKTKRFFIEDKYKNAIEALYADTDSKDAYVKFVE
eukprot:m.83257 g.83257  ORF g.83257 m.83257 type:complete len:749 (+) comp25609_c0_seq2:162-2408(+)